MDSDILNNLSEAIFDKFSELTGGAHNTYYESIGGRLIEGRVTPGTVYPYSVLEITNATPRRTFSHDHEELLVTFKHYSDSSSPTEVKLINAYCNELFDEGSYFLITGASLEWMKRASSPGAIPEEIETPAGTDLVYCCPTDYEVNVLMNSDNPEAFAAWLAGVITTDGLPASMGPGSLISDNKIRVTINSVQYDISLQRV